MSDRLDHHLGEDLIAFVDGGESLAPERKKALDAHVAGCTECQQALASAKLVLHTVDSAELPAPSPAFDAALFRRLDAIERETKAGAGSFIDRLRAVLTLPKIGFTVAAAASIVVAVVVIDRRGADNMTIELAQNLEGLRVADNLDLYRNLEVVENLDVLDDLDAIQAMD